ncbi:MAG: hypothetical protein C4547_13515 [Phycisphaerales bacterium]|nr:MAG: hypothetical protein C4547_13515 [Phycisphaerales bacterium]
MAESIADFVDRVGGPRQFVAEPWLNRAGDCIEWHFVPDAYHADRVDGVLTLFRSDECDAEVVGFQIKGVSALYRVLGDFGVVVGDGAVAVGVLILGAYWTGDDLDRPRRREAYQCLKQRLGKDADRKVFATS